MEKPTGPNLHDLIQFINSTAVLKGTEKLDPLAVKASQLAKIDTETLSHEIQMANASPEQNFISAVYLSKLEQIQREYQTGRHGTATSTNAPINHNNTLLFASFKVDAPLPLPNSWGLEVTPTELKDRDVFFDILNSNIEKNIISRPQTKTASQQVVEEDISTTENYPEDKSRHNLDTERLDGESEDLLGSGSMAFTANETNQSIFEKADRKVNLGDQNTEKIVTFGEFLNKDKRMYIICANQSSFGANAGPKILPSGQSNIGWGHLALSKVTTGLCNAGFGLHALRDAVGAIDNSAFGAGALEKLQEGVGNSAIGRLALANITHNGHNTGLGDTALEKLEDGDNNTSTGYGSGVGLRTGSANSLYGIYTGGHPLGGYGGIDANWNFNTVMGAFSMQYNMSGSYNSYFGSNVAYNSTSGEYNVAVGSESLYESTTASYNSCLGFKAGAKLIGGVANIFIGFRSGGETGQKVDAFGTVVIGQSVISTRDNEVVIGKNADTHFTICGVEFTKAQLQALKALVS